jgi:DNA-binding NarL/FixJ family response regulator
MRIRILLVDDHQITREGLRALLEKEEEFEIVAEASNGRDAVKFALDLAPDVVLMDVAMPDLNGVEATRQILETKKNIRIIALSMHSEKQFVAKMMEAGASGYLLKDCAFDELTHGIRVVHEGGTYLGQQIAPVVVQDYVQSLRDKKSFFSSLTPREREVVQLIAEGHSTKEIAYKLNVSTKTVETHRRNTMEKLKIDNVAELTKFAIREGLTDLKE